MLYIGPYRRISQKPQHAKHDERKIRVVEIMGWKKTKCQPAKLKLEVRSRETGQAKWKHIRAFPLRPNLRFPLQFREAPSGFAVGENGGRLYRKFGSWEGAKILRSCTMPWN